eukprot:Seg1493.8 transcript_id=Seg1493.8/GoldUCD/mRNA.D3Y31 product="Zinc finger protein 331" protein_id=Seg1493.8/GoldUCD/D3Y31
MEIQKLNQQNNHAITAKRTYITENMTKSNCVLSFGWRECRPKEGLVLFWTLPVHLQDHNQAVGIKNPNQINTNGHCLEDDITAVENDGLVESNAAGNCFKGNLVCDSNHPEENGAVGSNTNESEKRETDIEGIDRDWSKGLLSNSKTNGSEHNMVDDAGISIINAHVTLQNVSRNVSRNLSKKEVQPRNEQVQDSLGNVTKLHLEQSDSNQIARGSSERCNSLIDGEERDSKFEGRAVKLEDNDGNNVELNRNVSKNIEHTEDDHQCNNLKTLLERNEEDIHETVIKEEEHDDYHDVDSATSGIIGGFLEDSIDDIHDNDESYNGELVPGCSFDHVSQTEITRPYTATISTSDELCQPTITSRSLKMRKFDERSETANSEEISGTCERINMKICGNLISNVNTIVGTEHPQKGSCKRRKGAFNRGNRDVCKVHEKSLKASEHLKVHQGVNTREKSHSCDICEMKFSRSDYLKQHKMVHTGERPFSCNSCGKSFTRCSSLRLHEGLHAGEKLFSCKFCGKSFYQRGNLTAHERIHTGEKPHSCKVCGESFRWKKSLILHGRVHTGEKLLFPCNKCGKSVASRWNLNRHMKVHAGE